MIVRNIITHTVAPLVLSLACYPQIVTRETPQKPVAHDPFVLKLRINNEHYYEETIDGVPYVAENEVYLFAGETFGINVTANEKQISRITYQRDPTKADVEFKLTQEKSPNGFMMLLVIRFLLVRTQA